MIALATVHHATPLVSQVELDHLLTLRARVRHSPDSVGATPDGLQITFGIGDGNVTSPRLTSLMRAIGSDWLIVRPDGTGVLDLRIAIETVDGALIYAPYHGRLDHDVDAWNQGLRESPLRKPVPIQIAARFQSSDPRYHWLHELPCVGLGQISPQQVELRCAFAIN